MIRPIDTPPSARAQTRPAPPRNPADAAAGADRFRDAMAAAVRRDPRREVGTGRDQPLRDEPEAGFAPAQGQNGGDRPVIDKDASSGRDGAVAIAAGMPAADTGIGGQPAILQSDAAGAQASGPDAAFARVAAALDAPLAALPAAPRGASFTLDMTGAQGTLAARVQIGADGRLTVALALPGLSTAQREALSRDLRRHLSAKGFADSVVDADEAHDPVEAS